MRGGFLNIIKRYQNIFMEHLNLYIELNSTLSTNSLLHIFLCKIITPKLSTAWLFHPKIISKILLEADRNSFSVPKMGYLVTFGRFRFQPKMDFHFCFIFRIHSKLSFVLCQKYSVLNWTVTKFCDIGTAFITTWAVVRCMPPICFLVMHIVNVGGMTTEWTWKLLQHLRPVSIKHRPIDSKH